MLRRAEAIVCRRCHELVRLSEGACPECGTRVRSLLGLSVVLALGTVTLWLAVSPFDAVTALVGVALLAVGAIGLRDRRQRVRDARRRREA